MRGLPISTAIILVAIGVAAASAPLSAQGATADFQLADYVVVVNGAKADTAEVWQSRIAGELLILSDEIGQPVRLSLRDARVETVHLMKVDRRPDGGLTLLPNAADNSYGNFKVAPDGHGVSFTLDGRTVELKEKPPLLGQQDLDAMRAYSRDYVRLAEAYQPSKPFLDRIRSDSRAVRVEVYFGSWCPFCQQMVPRIMRVAEELADSNIEVGFYGLPQGQGFSLDPRAKALEITGVPTGVVYIEGREVGRINGNSWKIPELTLNNILIKQ
jgi:thiol-disulfide isomerase/thioredoxin